MQNEYITFMRRYEVLGHMTWVANEELATPICYLIHHGVIKESLTTKLSIAFNASTPTSNDVSINDLQMVGPTIQ